MNSVHEPGPNGDSKISPSRKPIQKAKPYAQAPSRPSRHAQVRTGAPRRAHGCRIVAESPAVSWQGVGRIVGSSGRVVASLLHAPRASACAPAPNAPAPALARPARSLAQPTARLAPYRGRPAGRIAAPSAVSQRASGRIVGVSVRHACAQPTQLHNTIFCIAAKNQPTLAPQSQYKQCIAIHFCLAYPLPVAILGLYHNTILSLSNHSCNIIGQ